MTTSLAHRLCLAAALAACACNVDETGYIVPPEVGYSAPAALEDGVDATLFVVGEPGAITTGGGALTVQNMRTGALESAVVDDDRGSFAAQIDARLGDALELRYHAPDGGEDDMELAIDDDLASVAQPAWGTTVLLSEPDAEGMVTVYVGNLIDPVTPVLIVNLATGYAVLAEEATPEPRIPAAAGDRICLYYRPSTGETSSAACESVF